MRKANYSRTIYHLCLDSDSHNEYVLALEATLRLPLHRIEPEELLKPNGRDKHKILLLEYSQAAELRKRLGTLRLSERFFETIVINVHKRLTTDELLTLGNLKGLFYQSDSVEQITADLEQIINGSNRLPRAIMSQLLHFFRHVHRDHQMRAAIDLTAREIQILRCLQTDSTNIQIAENLFISEFTVKSHLYQIFKKLCVKNRVKAIAWANENLQS